MDSFLCVTMPRRWDGCPAVPVVVAGDGQDTARVRSGIQENWCFRTYQGSTPAIPLLARTRAVETQPDTSNRQSRLHRWPLLSARRIPSQRQRSPQHQLRADSSEGSGLRRATAWRQRRKVRQGPRNPRQEGEEGSACSCAHSNSPFVPKQSYQLTLLSGRPTTTSTFAKGTVPFSSDENRDSPQLVRGRPLTALSINNRPKRNRPLPKRL